jgi:peptidoglycan/xylan/chitin deacetylase (PgdA/CDA1 family)
MHLNAAEIRSISDNGHEIGSHTHTHANLTYLAEKDLIEELRTSKKVLEDITGKEVKSISFPHGSWNQRVWSSACNEGYTYASLYRGHSRSNDPGHFPVLSAGRFDTEKCCLKRYDSQHNFLRQ